tara:strand:+ start:35 stop:241 length:207 start_codon:yes stop_codon:yes gene_type:complete
MNITLNVPNDIAQELDQVAQTNGFPDAKEMIIAYLRATIRSNRVEAANLDAAREAAELQADTDTRSIT